MRVRLLNVKFLVPFFIVLAALSVHGAERKPAPAALASLRVVPQEVTLWGAQASQHFLVLAEYADGLERDVTSSVRFSLSGTDKGEIDGSGKLVAQASGEAVLTAKFGGRSAKTTIRIEDADKPRPFTFAREVGGILTKRGCNDISCHGGVKGRGGFKLSVCGLYPREDYKWIVEGGTFRVLTTDTDPKNPRINLKEPAKSLLLMKPTFSVPHGGGLRFVVGSPDYQAILNWIRAGRLTEKRPNNEASRWNGLKSSPRKWCLMLEAGSNS